MSISIIVIVDCFCITYTVKIFCKIGCLYDVNAKIVCNVKKEKRIKERKKERKEKNDN